MCERICTLPHADALLKGAEAECKSLKDEFKRRGLTEVAGQSFTVIASGQIAGRLTGSFCVEFFSTSPRSTPHFGHAKILCSSL